MEKLFASKEGTCFGIASVGSLLIFLLYSLMLGMFDPGLPILVPGIMITAIANFALSALFIHSRQVLLGEKFISKWTFVAVVIQPLLYLFAALMTGSQEDLYVHAADLESYSEMLAGLGGIVSIAAFITYVVMTFIANKAKRRASYHQ